MLHRNNESNDQVKRGTMAAAFQLAGVARSASGARLVLRRRCYEALSMPVVGFAIVPGDCGASDTSEAAQIRS